METRELYTESGVLDYLLRGGESRPESDHTTQPDNQFVVFVSSSSRYARISHTKRLSKSGRES